MLGVCVSSCFFNLELPAYSSVAVMRRMMTAVIAMDVGMNADDQIEREMRHAGGHRGGGVDRGGLSERERDRDRSERERQREMEAMSERGVGAGVGVGGGIAVGVDGSVDELDYGDDGGEVEDGVMGSGEDGEDVRDEMDEVSEEEEEDEQDSEEYDEQQNEWN